MGTQTFRVGFVGAGEISPVHIEGVQAILAENPHISIVGICDLDAQRAAETAEKYGLKTYPSLEALVEAGANVVHVLTPAQAHARVAIEAMNLGCDVFIEKPMAESVAECQQILDTARATGRTATIDHLLLFDPGIQKAIAAVEAGKIGKVVGMDILRGAEITGYSGGPLPARLGDPGDTFRDMAVHHFYLFQKFLGPIEDVKAEWMSLGGEPSIAWDEWRALVRCRDGLGQFQISYNAKPIQNQVILHGTRGVLRIDLFSLFQSTRKSMGLPTPVERLVNVAIDSAQPLVQTPNSVFKFATKKIQRLQGVRSHIAEFYKRLGDGTPQEVTLESAMELVKWNEIIAEEAVEEYRERLAPFEKIAPKVDVAVTGATGSLGGAIVRRLMSEGHSIRAVVRRIPDRPIEGIDYVIGNLGDPAFVTKALKGATKVIHAGAAVAGTEAQHRAATIEGTRNVIASCRENGVSQLVHISSMSVLHNAAASGNVVNEESPMEPRADERGAYTLSKLEAERLVTAAVAEGLPAVILRPGSIIGAGIKLETLAGGKGTSPSRSILLGDGEAGVALVYIEDVVDAVMLAADKNITDGSIFQICDDRVWTQNSILQAIYPDIKLIHIPKPVMMKIGKATEPLFAKIGKQSPMSEYRLESGMAKRKYDSSKARDVLGWTQHVGVEEGIRRYVAAM